MNKLAEPEIEDNHLYYNSSNTIHSDKIQLNFKLERNWAWKIQLDKEKKPLKEEHRNRVCWREFDSCEEFQERQVMKRLTFFGKEREFWREKLKFAMTEPVCDSVVSKFFFLLSRCITGKTKIFLSFFMF